MDTPPFNDQRNIEKADGMDEAQKKAKKKSKKKSKKSEKKKTKNKKPKDAASHHAASPSLSVQHSSSSSSMDAEVLDCLKRALSEKRLLDSQSSLANEQTEGTTQDTLYDNEAPSSLMMGRGNRPTDEHEAASAHRVASRTMAKAKAKTTKMASPAIGASVAGEEREQTPPTCSSTTETTYKRGQLSSWMPDASSEGKQEEEKVEPVSLSTPTTTREVRASPTIQQHGWQSYTITVKIVDGQRPGLKVVSSVDGRVFVSMISSDGLFAGSRLRVGERVLAINGRPSTNLLSPEITDLLRLHPDRLSMTVTIRRFSEREIRNPFQFSHKSIQFTCTSCSYSGVTRTDDSYWDACFAGCGLWMMCGWFMFCCLPTREVQHFCPGCNRHLGTFIEEMCCCIPC